MNTINLIKDYIINNELENAFNLILKNEKEYTENPEYWSLRGLLCLKVQEYETAIKCLGKSIELNNKDENVYYNLGYAYENIKDYSDAALYYGLAYRYTEDNELKEELEKKYKDSNLISIFRTAAILEQKTFIVLSSCGWGDIYQRMHHISRSLAKFGNLVKYICPNIDVNIDNKLDIEAGIDWSITNKRTIDNVDIYQPIVAKHNNETMWQNYINLVQELINSSEKEVILITYMPKQYKIIQQLKGKFYHIYECVDDHSDIEYAFWGSKSDILYEQHLMDSADAITTTATSLYLKRKCIENRDNVYLSRNAVNEIDFIENSDDKIPEDLENIPEPRVVYHGAIYEWFDMDLFYHVVKNNPDKSFVIIGFGKMDLFKEKFNNLYILEPKKHGELKKYLKYMQVGIVPFKSEADIIINCDAIKHYEYLACCLPVVTSFMPEACMDKINTFVATDKYEFNEYINKCIKIDIEKEFIVKFISSNSWNKRAAILCNILYENEINEKECMDYEIVLKNIDCMFTRYNNSISKAFKAVISDNSKAEELMEKAYLENNNKFIEKMYLTTLLKNKNYIKFIDVVTNSENIPMELKKDILQVKNNNLLKYIVFNICVSNFKEALNLLDTLEIDNNIKLDYKAYIKYKLGLVGIKDIKIASTNSNKKSYIHKFMLKEINEFKFYQKKLNEDIFISVMIPTRNSANVVRYALMTCIEQNYENYEVIVSDNSSIGNDETKKVVEELNCDKIKYYRTPEELSMPENYNYAYSKCKGEYIINIGSDDGLLLHCLEKINKVIKDLNYPMSITWDTVAYGWPDVNIECMKNGLFIPYPTQENNINASYRDISFLKSVLNFESRYSVLPMFYCNSIIKRELAEKAKEIAGNVFCADAPDVYTGIVFAYLQGKYIHIDMPMSIGGSSGKSVGINGEFSLSKDEFLKNYEWENKRIKDNFGYEIEMLEFYLGLEGTVKRVACQCKKIFFENDAELDINMESFYKKVIKNIYEGYSNIDYILQLLHKSIIEYGDENIIKWFEENYISVEFNGYKKYQDLKLNAGYFERGLVIDASNFNVTNVYEASNLHRKIVSY